MSTPKGTTVIVHSIRKKLCISVSEYTVLDAIQQLELLNKKATDALIAEFIGMEKVNVLFLLNQIPNLFYHIHSDGTITATDEWKKHFNTDADFEEFWKIWQMRGVKKKAATAYKAARKKVDKETLHRRAKLVVDSATEWKFIPHAQNWLNNERWNEFNPIFDTSIQTGADDNTPKLVM